LDAELELEEDTICVLCSAPLVDNEHHNAEPVASGRCCTPCNYSRVIPKRLAFNRPRKPDDQDEADEGEPEQDKAPKMRVIDNGGSSGFNTVASTPSANAPGQSSTCCKTTLAQTIQRHLDARGPLDLGPNAALSTIMQEQQIPWISYMGARTQIPWDVMMTVPPTLCSKCAQSALPKSRTKVHLDQDCDKDQQPEEDGVGSDYQLAVDQSIKDYLRNDDPSGDPHITEAKAHQPSTRRACSLPHKRGKTTRCERKRKKLILFITQRMEEIKQSEDTILRLFKEKDSQPLPPDLYAMKARWKGHTRCSQECHPPETSRLEALYRHHLHKPPEASHSATFRDRLRLLAETCTTATIPGCDPSNAFRQVPVYDSRTLLEARRLYISQYGPLNSVQGPELIESGKSIWSPWSEPTLE